MMIKNKTNKKICMVVYTNYSLDARVKREAETLANESKFDVVVLIPKENLVAQTKMIDGIFVREMNIKKYKGQKRFEYIKSYIKFFWYSLIACTKLFVQKKVDIVHVHNMPNFLVFAAIIPRFFGIKIILDIHDTMPETFLSKFKNDKRIFYKALCLEEKICCAFVNRIICVNHVQAEELIKRGIPSEKIFISMNVPDHKRFPSHKIIDSNRADHNGFRMVYHGTIARRLGIDLSIHAVSRLVNEIPEIEFNIWGPGEFLNECIETSRKLGIAEKIKFNGIVPFDDIKESLKGMDIGVIANRRDAATELMLPVKMLEYIALGIPVVAPRTRCIKYYFSEDMVSFFDPEDVASLADAILKIYKDKSLRIRQAEKAKIFLEKYGWEKHHKDLIKFYEQL